MYLKIHQSARGDVVAACDEELLGKVLEDKDAFMDLARYRGFYEGEKAGEDGLEKALGRFFSANLVGRGPVSVALRMGLAGKGDVRYIKKVPYIQIYRI